MKPSWAALIPGNLCCNAGYLGGDLSLSLGRKRGWGLTFKFWVCRGWCEPLWAHALPLRPCKHRLTTMAASR